MTIIQILIIVFALFAIIRAVMQFKNGTLAMARLFFWIVFWIAVGTVAASPATADVTANIVGVGRGADLVIYLSLTALFYLVFRIYVKIEKVEGEITSLVRERSLDELDKDQ